MTCPYWLILAQSLLQRIVFLTPVSVMGLMLTSLPSSSMAAILILATVFSSSVSLILDTVTILQRVSSESELLPESVWICLAVSLFLFWQSLEAA